MVVARGHRGLGVRMAGAIIGMIKIIAHRYFLSLITCVITGINYFKHYTRYYNSI